MNKTQTGILDKFIFLIVGASGSGKDTLVSNWCKDFELTKIKSYTTRPKRENDVSDSENHTFVTKEEFDKLNNIIAYTSYNGYEYCATSEQVDNNNFYIIDTKGVLDFKNNYNGNKIPIVVYIDVPEEKRIERMRNRGDDENSINNRIKYDRVSFNDLNLSLINIDIIIDNSSNLIETRWGDSITLKYGNSASAWSFAEMLNCFTISTMITKGIKSENKSIKQMCYCYQPNSNQND